jgi:5-(carboxyamino)imidazole ribonucleotide synthase
MLAAKTRLPVLGVPVQSRTLSGLDSLLSIVQMPRGVPVGTLAIGEAGVANETACRVHNSGHWTDVGARTSQFENHLRAVLGWPLGDTSTLGPTAMLNLIGDVPDPASLLALPDARLHLYGKTPAPGRKLGHVTLRARRSECLEAVWPHALAAARAADHASSSNS